MMFHIFDIIQKIRKLQSRRGRVILLGLVVLTFFVSLIDTLGISSIMLFIAVVINPLQLQTNHFLFLVQRLLAIGSANAFIRLMGLTLIGIYLIRLGVLIGHAYYMYRYSSSQFKNIAIALYQKYIHMPYLSFVKRNTGELTKMIIQESNNFSTFIQNFMYFWTELLGLLMVYAIVLFISWKITLVMTFAGLFFAVTVNRKLAVILTQLGQQRYHSEQIMFRMIAGALGNFKALQFSRYQRQSTDYLNHSLMNYSQAYVRSGTLYQLPKNIFEFSGFTAIVLLIFYLLHTYHQSGAVLSTISVYVIALYRILPGLHKSITYFNQSMYYYKTLEVIVTDIDETQDADGDQSIDFQSEIRLSDLSFGYEGNPVIFEHLNLVIRHHDKVAFVGESGSGKTTLVDMLAGLISPSSGTITVDGVPLDSTNRGAWRAKIGYIPQHIYLFDGTVADNVVFGEAYDEAKLIRVLKEANVYDFLGEKQGLRTMVGDNGVQLSGGQKQRIGIARALYKDPEILVMDEATSALDSHTEATVIDDVFDASRNKTVIVITHREATIANCDRIYTIDKGGIQ